MTYRKAPDSDDTHAALAKENALLRSDLEHWREEAHGLLNGRRAMLAVLFVVAIGLGAGGGAAALAVHW